MTFSASGETPINKDVKLPKAENTLDMIDAPMVAITGSQILVDGSAAGNTRAIEDAKRLQRIDELFNILKAQARALEAAAPGQGFPGRRRSSNRSGRPGGRREERVPDGRVRGLPERQLHGRTTPEDRVTEDRRAAAAGA